MFRTHPLNPSSGKETAHAAARGAIAAMAMTGMRRLTTQIGLVEQTPPEAVANEGAPGLVDGLPPDRRRVAVELAHWAYGSTGGILFALLPERVRRAPLAGPAYGLVLWLAFELAVSPALGLKRVRQQRGAERASLAADHVLYGLVLSEFRTRPQR